MPMCPGCSVSDSRSIASSIGQISSDVSRSVLTRRASGIAATTCCIPPRSSSMQHLKITASRRALFSSAVTPSRSFSSNPASNASGFISVISVFSADNTAWGPPRGMRTASAVSSLYSSALGLRSQWPTSDEVKLCASYFVAEAYSPTIWNYFSAKLNAKKAHTYQQFADQLREFVCIERTMASGRMIKIYTR